MTKRLYVDVETRSSADLDKQGAMRYARDEWAGINAIAFAVDEGPLEQLRREECVKGSTSPGMARFQSLFYTAEKIIAHSAEFEMIIFGVLLGLWRPVDCWSCTKAKAGYYGYPRSLDGCAKALCCAHLKDIEGKAAMLWCANPVNTPEDGPETYERMYKYSLCDIPPMRDIDRKLPDLPKIVQDNWVADTEINLRGTPVDRKVLANGIWLRATAGEQANERMAALTQDQVFTVNQTKEIQAFVARDSCVIMRDCTADEVEKTLSYEELNPASIAVLELRQDSGLTSLAKYERMEGEQVGGRIYQVHDWYGTHTGRPTGNRSQMLNLPRSEEADYYAGMIAESPWFLLQMPKPMEKLKEAIRGAFCAEDGNTLIGCDQSQGEARGTAWVSGDQALLNLFTSGTDPYCKYGEPIFGHPLDKYLHADKRQAAKASVLAYGFAGGIGAGQRIGTNHKMNFSALADVVMPLASPKELASALWCYNYYRESFPPKPLSEREGMAFDVLKQWYRRDFPQVVAYWKVLEDAFLNGGQAGRVSVRILPGNGRAIRLPSGRELFYRDVQINAGGYSYKSRFNRETLWHGQLMENVVQAISTDVNNFYKALVREWAKIVHHCYDEFTIECLIAEAVEYMKRLQDVTQRFKPEWADGYPLAFDYWQGKRYGK